IVDDLRQGWVLLFSGVLLLFSLISPFTSTSPPPFTLSLVLLSQVTLYPSIFVFIFFLYFLFCCSSVLCPCSTEVLGGHLVRSLLKLNFLGHMYFRMLDLLADLGFRTRQKLVCMSVV
ncbi:hypothetical protein VIGAN_03081700, partial [Vigna angularis var. angularis]